jgi:hypothetical protein
MPGNKDRNYIIHLLSPLEKLRITIMTETTTKYT